MPVSLVCGIESEAILKKISHNATSGGFAYSDISIVIERGEGRLVPRAEGGSLKSNLLWKEAKKQRSSLVRRGGGKAQAASPGAKSRKRKEGKSVILAASIFKNDDPAATLDWLDSRPGGEEKSM